MSFHHERSTGRPITIKDEGITLVENVGSIDFAGGGVTGSVLGSDATETIAGGILTSVLTTAGDIIYASGGAATATRLGIGSANTVLHGGASAPSYSAVVEADMTLSNNSTNDATTTRHGFLPILSNVATQFLNGQGNFAVPSGTAASYTTQAFSAQTTVTVTHNFGAYPIVQVIDNTGAVLVPLTTVNNSINDFTVTFDASTTGNIIASVGSPPASNLLVTAADYTLVAGDQIVKVTASGKVITLLTAVGRGGKTFTIDNASGGSITVNTTSSQTIQGVLSQPIGSQSAMVVYSDGANWRIT